MHGNALVPSFALSDQETTRSQRRKLRKPPAAFEQQAAAHAFNLGSAGTKPRQHDPYPPERHGLFRSFQQHVFLNMVLPAKGRCRLFGQGTLGRPLLKRCAVCSPLGSPRAACLSAQNRPESAPADGSHRSWTGQDQPFGSNALALPREPARAPAQGPALGTHLNPARPVPGRRGES